MRNLLLNLTLLVRLCFPMEVISPVAVQSQFESASALAVLEEPYLEH